MRIVHRIGFRASEFQRKELEALGVKLQSGITMPGGGHPFTAFDFQEDHPNWPRLRAVLQQWGISEGVVRTEFSETEKDSARWLGIGAWLQGYPQPDEDEFGYREATYCLSEWCDVCGVGLRQRAPFQMEREPKWSRRGMFQLNWVFDELFVLPEVWSSVFKSFGVSCRPVANTKGGVLKSVVQIVVEEEAGIVTDRLTPDLCAKCRRVKYRPHTRGPLPALVSEPVRAIVRTREYFGSGASAHRLVLVSQDLRLAMIAEKVRGALFWPVQCATGTP